MSPQTARGPQGAWLRCRWWVRRSEEVQAAWFSPAGSPAPVLTPSLAYREEQRRELRLSKGQPPPQVAQPQNRPLSALPPRA